MTDEAEGAEAPVEELVAPELAATVDADLVLDTVIVSQIPVCDTDGSVKETHFFNAAGQRIR